MQSVIGSDVLFVQNETQIVVHKIEHVDRSFQSMKTLEHDSVRIVDFVHDQRARQIYLALLCSLVNLLCRSRFACVLCHCIVSSTSDVGSYWPRARHRRDTLPVKRKRLVLRLDVI